jgi:hypothetical protein
LSAIGLWCFEWGGFRAIPDGVDIHGVITVAARPAGSKAARWQNWVRKKDVWALAYKSIIS